MVRQAQGPSLVVGAVVCTASAVLPTRIAVLLTMGVQFLGCQVNVDIHHDALGAEILPTRQSCLVMDLPYERSASVGGVLAARMAG